jgi:hypothetical protein
MAQSSNHQHMRVSASRVPESYLTTLTAEPLWVPGLLWKIVLNKVAHPGYQVEMPEPANFA